MATIQLYKNPNYYPHFSRQHMLAPSGDPMECKPVGMNLKTGTLQVAGTMADFTDCNYLRLHRDGTTLWAWIDDVRYLTAGSFEVDYSIDAYRTYMNRVTFGHQYIERRPEPTSQLDPLLGAEQDYPLVTSKMITTDSVGWRTFVVQVRPSTGDIFSNTPVQPSPYNFYLINYPVNDWTSSQPLNDLMLDLMGNAESTNLVTIYSIPKVDISDLPAQPLLVDRPSGSTTIDGFKFLSMSAPDTPNQLLTNRTEIIMNEDISELMRVPHNVQLVLPEAGVIEIPDELLNLGSLYLQQDIDLFSGASNYMLCSPNASGEYRYYTQSARGSAISSIPVLSDPVDTYMSQNQNALATSLMGDVASIAGGVAMTAGTGGAGALFGGGAITGGVNGIMSKVAGTKDAGAKVSNPPAFLGTALAGNFNGRMWLVVTRDPVDNADDVHRCYGYQYGKVEALVPPDDGYIKTQGCSIHKTDGTVPRWAINEICTLFDNGIEFHSETGTT